MRVVVRNQLILTSYDACLMNCLAGCLQIAGTVITQRISSLTILVEDWSDSSCKQWSLKNLKACENTFSASIFFPLAAWISTPLCKSWEGQEKEQTITGWLYKQTALSMIIICVGVADPCIAAILIASINGQVAVTDSTHYLRTDGQTWEIQPQPSSVTTTNSQELTPCLQPTQTPMVPWPPDE